LLDQPTPIYGSATRNTKEPQLQEQEVERLEQGLPTLVEEKIAEKLQISTDGAMVPLLHGVWAEVKTRLLHLEN
jgi:hypothetical protein